MSIEKIREVFRQAGLYGHAADDLLCERLAEVAGAVQPQAAQVARMRDDVRLAMRQVWDSPYADVNDIWDEMAAAAIRTVLEHEKDSRAHAGVTMWRDGLSITLVVGPELEQMRDHGEAFTDLAQRALDSLAAAWDARQEAMGDE